MKSTSSGSIHFISCTIICIIIVVIDFLTEAMNIIRGCQSSSWPVKLLLAKSWREISQRPEDYPGNVMWFNSLAGYGSLVCNGEIEPALLTGASRCVFN